MKYQLGTIFNDLLKCKINFINLIINKLSFPTPSVPDILMVELIPDAIIISLVTFATSISIADLYARKHKYKLDSNRVYILDINFENRLF